MRRSLLALVLALPAAPSAFAGLYSLDEPCPFTVNPDGTANPLPHPLFNAKLTDRETPGLPLDPAKPATAGWATTDDWGRPLVNAAGEPVAVVQGSGRVGQLLAARWPKAAQLRGADLLSHTAALVVAGGSQQALNLLFDRGRVGGDYSLRANRAHAFAASGLWSDAVTNLPDEPDDPTPPPGTSAEQFAWQRRLDQTAYLRWLKHRETDATTRRPPADPTQTPLPLFHTPDGQPIRYWEGASEAAKLPPDAVAVVQQLLLWEPNDNLLRWSLAEAYAATGNVRAAEAAYRSLTAADGRNFGGPRLLDGLRRRVAEEYAQLPPEQPVVPDLPADTPAPPDPDPSPLVFGLVDPVTFYVAGGVFVLLVAGLLALQVRAVARRRKNRADIP